jgi:hypothetical protein
LPEISVSFVVIVAGLQLDERLAVAAFKILVVLEILELPLRRVLRLEREEVVLDERAQPESVWSTIS